MGPEALNQFPPPCLLVSRERERELQWGAKLSCECLETSHFFVIY